MVMVLRVFFSFYFFASCKSSWMSANYFDHTWRKWGFSFLVKISGWAKGMAHNRGRAKRSSSRIPCLGSGVWAVKGPGSMDPASRPPNQPFVQHGHGKTCGEPNCTLFRELPRPDLPWPFELTLVLLGSPCVADETRGGRSSRCLEQ